MAVVALEEGDLGGDSDGSSEGIHVDLVGLPGLIPSDDQALAARELIEIDHDVAPSFECHPDRGLPRPRCPGESDVHTVAESRPR